MYLLNDKSLWPIAQNIDLYQWQIHVLVTKFISGTIATNFVLFKIFPLLDKLFYLYEYFKNKWKRRRFILWNYSHALKINWCTSKCIKVGYVLSPCQWRSFLRTFQELITVLATLPMCYCFVIISLILFLLFYSICWYTFGIESLYFIISAILYRLQNSSIRNIPLGASFIIGPGNVGAHMYYG